MIMLLSTSKFATANIEYSFEMGSKHLWGVPFILFVVEQAKLKPPHTEEHGFRVY